MSLKLPGIGKKIDSYSYCVAIDNVDDINVLIKFTVKNYYGVSVKKNKIIEIHTDLRWKQGELIVEMIQAALNDGLVNNKKIVIKEDKNRYYIWINDMQFTGAIL